MRRFEVAAVLAVVVLGGIGDRLASGGDPPPAGRVRGVVVRGENDIAEPGRTVTLAIDGAAPRTVTTDAWGRFAFDGVVPGPRTEVLVEADGCAEVRVANLPLLPHETRDVGELWLGPARVVDVFVADEAGVPIDGATVEAFRQETGEMADFLDHSSLDLSRRPVVVASTDPSGHAKLSVARGPHWTVAARAPGRARVAEARLKTSEVALELPTAQTFSGRVLDAEGRPVPSAVVVARRHVASWGRCGTCSPLAEGAALWQTARTDASGRYAFEALPPGILNVMAAPPDGAAAFVGSVQFPTVGEFDVVLPPTGSITGRVTDAVTGAPAPGIAIAAGPEYSSRVIAVTDADGVYRLDGLAAGSEISFHVELPEAWTTFRSADFPFRDFALRPGQRAVLDATVESGGTVTGRVFLDSAPVPNANVRVATLPESGDSLFGRVIDARADVNGTFRAEGVKAGRVVLFATVPGDDASAAWGEMYKRTVKDRTARTHEGFDVAAGQTVARDIAIRRWPRKETDDAGDRERPGGGPSARMRLRVTTADGLPLVDAKWAYGAPDRLGRRLSFWRPVPPGGLIDEEVRVGDSVEVTAWDDRHGVATVTVPAKQDGHDAVAELRLPAFPSLEGRVVGAGGPVADASILVNRVLVARTGSAGTFRVTCEKDSDIIVRARGFMERRFEKRPETGATEFVVELQPAARIEGQVVDGAGRGVAGLVVVAAKADAGAVTDRDGRFRLDGVPRGEWRVRVEAGPGAPAVRTVETEPVSADTVDLRIEVAPERRITGRVVGPDGRPDVEAEVVCRPGTGADADAKFRTDDRGRFHFGGLGDGEHVLDVKPSWGSELTPARVHLAPDRKDGDEVVIRLVPAQAIGGVILLPDGSPVLRTEVEAVRVDAPGEDAPPWPWDLDDWSEDADGSFRIVVPPGARFRLQFGRGGRMRDRAILRGGEDVKSGTTDLKLTADTGIKISGVVVDEAGNPIVRPDIETRLSFADKRDLRARDDGKFEVTGLPAGKADLLIRADGYIPVRLPAIETGTSGLRVVLKKGLTITGRLLDADGKPGKGHWVRAVSPAWPAIDLWRVQPDEDGAFEITGLDAGDWYVQSFIPGCMRVDDVKTHGNVKAGTRDLELRLEKP